MKTKLTLCIEEDLIKKAKIYTAKAGKSVSDLVADYFSLFQVERKEKQELSPKVAFLKSILQGRKIDEDYQIAEATLQDAGTFEFEEILAGGKNSGQQFNAFKAD